MQKEISKIERAAGLLLKISAMLMIAGANTTRIFLSLYRFSAALGYKAHALITHRAIIMTITDELNNESLTKVKRIPPHGVNFRIISGLSRASWAALNEKWSVDQVEAEVTRLRNLPHYPRILILISVSLAGSGFCNIFGGDWLNMLMAFIATFMGLFVRQEAVKMKFNQYICVFLGSFSASIVASFSVMYDIGLKPELSLATSVLFLVPGVPLINSFTDTIDGNLINGIVRFAHGTMIVLAIALGLFSAMMLFQLRTV